MTNEKKTAYAWFCIGLLSDKTDESLAQQFERALKVYDLSGGERNGKTFDFEPLWARYPDKSGKKPAFGHFKVTIKTDEDYSNIKKALDNYLRSGRVLNGYVMNGKTWFNDWQAWVDPTPQMMRGKSKLEQSRPSDFSHVTVTEIK